MTKDEIKSLSFFIALVRVFRDSTNYDKLGGPLDIIQIRNIN